mmetsp:Transcript_21041/g.64106  ORF Transcript_21041/g.64106 Transcript_21041/m.64106 type:complete len:312 (-) Transcript_21041:921-1856(-)
MAQRLEGMVHLSPQNMILEEAIGPIFKDERRQARELRISDFDDVAYKLVVMPEEESVLTLQMSVPAAEQLKAAGAQALMDTAFSGMEVAAEPGFDFALRVDAAAAGGDVDALIAQITSFKTLVQGAPLQAQLEKLAGAGAMMSAAAADGAITAIDYRKGETMYICPGAGRVALVFKVDFQEPTDKSLARVFLQEFADAPRRVNNAPPTSFTPDPPGELASLGLPVGEDIAGYISFNVFPDHVKTPEKLAKVTRIITGFRAYLLYHIKASKTYLHMRMRSKVAAWLQVLNRATMEGEEKKKKTASGRTFSRK